ncbi:MAG: leucine-rich repeat protein [Candidatus Faecousia sp.]|nr:leucine-rich repeat protein [Candidatus Faecousia sp.]
MKKRILAIFLFFCMAALLSMSTFALGADIGVSETTIPYKVEGGSLYYCKETGTITGCDEAVTKADIPAQIDGTTVTAIGDCAFLGCTSLSSISIPSSVTSIGNGAFSDCVSLSAIQIPDSVTAIGRYAFECTGLTEINIPASVTAIGHYAFCGCTALTGIWVNEKNTRFSSDEKGLLFNKGKTKLLACPGGYTGKYDVPNSVTDIFWGAFACCPSLTGIFVDEANSCYSSDEKGVLFSKDKTELIRCPEGYTGTYAIPDGTVAICEYAFAMCEGLTGITIPSTVVSIYDSAFLCTGLVCVDIPASVERIDGNVFTYCEKLTSVTVNNKDCDIDFYAQVFGDPEITTIYGHAGSTAEAYAEKFGYQFKQIGASDPAGKVFTDVDKDKWYYDAVNFVVKEGLFAGATETTFEPDSTMTRAMLVTVLWRLADKPEAKGTAAFTDVPQDQYYAVPVLWAQTNGIVNGVSDTKFNPDGSITREQMAAILFRYAQKMGYDTAKRADLSAFPDAGKVSDYAKEALAWANAEGLGNGDQQTNGSVLLDPAGSATRAQVAAILMRFVEKTAK